MSDDIARQRFWSWNNAKTDPKSQRPRTPKGRSSGSPRPTVAATHVLLVRVHGTRDWRIVADGSCGRPRDVSGSEAFCRAEMGTRSRHFPAEEFCVLPWPEANRELRRKTWSVSDEDHIRNGERVMLMRAPAEIHPSLAVMHQTFGLSNEAEQRRTGVVKYRNHRSGDYMVRLDGTEVSVSVTRTDLIYPIPDNLIPLELRARSR